MSVNTQNVDPEEIQKFEAIAMRWWDSQGEFRPLHDINPIRAQYIEQLSHGISGKTVLDVGCGGGILSEALAKAGATVTGIDLGQANIDVAKMHLYESKLDVDYQVISIEELAQKQPQSFDVVTCMEMLEHVPDPQSIIQACSQLVKPEGDLFFSTLNRHFKAYLLGIMAAEYVLKLLPKGTHDYKKFIKPSEISRWIREADAQVMDISGITYNPLTSVCKIDNDIDVNYIMHARKD
ncbi:MAG: bifunctional 2-polyprenyl-6-hydroxyphenol methylase/3-demethylubiquinol 3-O-methyltransferase UbiG [Gammaproteobacteria bacterium]|nr:bifunctional 2-polyprenyl-6-hydroxyphenol methylase/3-demethylubiquinol 3-O-methyltransferase UbiG [Gammaproteobacteria bacterium]